MCQWDEEGRLVQTGMFSEREIQYSYVPGTNLLAGTVYDNGIAMTNTYELTRDLITDIAYKKADGTNISTRTYIYDTLRRPMVRTQQRTTELQREDVFHYNPCSELISATLGADSFSYEFDHIGNRKSAQENQENLLYISNHLNQYTSITNEGKESFVPLYDEDGSQTCIKTSTGLWNVIYDANNSPIRFVREDGSIVVENGYDHIGRRFEQKIFTNGLITKHERYLYRGYLQIASLDMLLNGERKQSIFWSPLEEKHTYPLMLIDRNGDKYYFTHDLTKNVAELLDSEGRIVTSYEYAPFGSVIESDSKPNFNSFQWSSEVYDTELGLVYYNYRFYNPSDGRWIGRDMIEETGGLNIYAFVDNLSTCSRDYLGLNSSTYKSNKGPITIPNTGPFAELAGALAFLCKKPKCCKKLDMAKCQEDARRFGKSVQATWNNLVKNPGNRTESNDNVNGYKCWDWAECMKLIFEEVVGSREGRSLSYQRGVIGKTKRNKYSTHVYIKICVCNCAKNEEKASECCKIVDNGFLGAPVNHPLDWDKNIQKDGWGKSSKDNAGDPMKPGNKLIIVYGS